MKMDSFILFYNVENRHITTCILCVVNLKIKHVLGSEQTKELICLIIMYII